MKKFISIIIVIIILFNITSFLFPNKVEKANSNRYVYDSNNMQYPGYSERIDVLSSAHPNWKFVVMETGLDWNDVIANEYTGHFDTPNNLIQGKSGAWICSICGNRLYDTGEWMCASESAIRYYMDPRNWLVDSPYLFQFLQTDYMETETQDIYEALNGTFLYSWENANIINQVCKNNNASPYFIMARILQEQGTTGGRTYRMQDTDGKIYYNLFNIGATGNNADEVYFNALEKAKQSGWTSIEACLNGGISFLISSYIGYKQNTLYLNKFDVEDYLGLYNHQYMQNIEAPKNEAISMYNKMKKANLLERNLTFVIPVYENMPQLASPSPDTTGEIFPKNIRVKEGHYGIMVRGGRSTTSSILGRIADSSVVVLSVERYKDGWHKVVLEDGTVGFVKFNSDYLEEIADVTNCYERRIVDSNNTTLRAGPGLEQAEITVLNKGDVVTRIDNTGRYNFGGVIWDRVIIADGRQGFVVRNSLKEEIDNENGNNKEEGNQSSQEPTDNQNESSNENVENQNETSNENAENQNETNNENVGNQTETNNENADNQTEMNNETIDNQTGTDNETMTNKTETKNETVVNQTETENKDGDNQTEMGNETTNNQYFIIGPDKKASDLGGIVTKDGLETEEAGTGYQIEIEGKTYTIVKRGDANGDGYVKANDYLIIKDYIIGTNTNLKDEYLEASDVTNDKAVKANDYLKIKDHIMYGVDI